MFKNLQRLMFVERGQPYHDEVLDVRDPSEFWLCLPDLPARGWRGGLLLLRAAGCCWAPAPSPSANGGAPLPTPPPWLPWLARLDRDQSRTSCWDTERSKQEGGVGGGLLLLMKSVI